jgi:hypothetical protein
MPQPNNKATEAEIARWSELDELEKYACTGPQGTEEQFTDRVQSLIDGTYLHGYLEKVQAEKKKLNNRMVLLEEIEVILLDKITKQNDKH